MNDTATAPAMTHEERCAAFIVRDEAKVALCREYFGSCSDTAVVFELLCRLRRAGNKQDAAGIAVATGIGYTEVLAVLSDIGAKKYRRNSGPVFGAQDSWM